MTQQLINIGSAPDDGTGDPAQTSFDKTNQNFTELYALNAGRIFYLDATDASDISGYKKLLLAPSINAASTIGVSCSGTGDVLIAAFATDSGIPGAAIYPAGTAYRRIYASTSAGAARLHLLVYVRNAAGVETLARDELSNSFVNTTVALQEWIATPASAGTLLATDRIVNKLYAQRVSGPATITVTAYFEGSTTGSHIQTTISPSTAGSSGAPVGAEYITSTADATLTAERVLTDTATVIWDRTTAGQIKATASKLGVTNGSNAAAGEIGEYVSAAAGAGIPASTFVAVTSFSLTAGDWDICAVGEFSNGTANARAFVSVSTNASAFGPAGNSAMVPISVSLDAYVTTALVRASIASPTTYYCIALSDNVVGSCFGKINARRVR